MRKMNELKIFESKEFGSIRTVEVNGEPYFVGKEVAAILGYVNQNRDIIRHVDEDDRMMINNESELNTETVSRLGQRGGWLINESGLYSLILSSKLPTAKKFKRWVTSEVLPSIRKHGAYMTDATLEQALTNPDFLIQLAIKLKEEQEARKKLEEQAERDKPKIIFADAVASSETSILIGDLAKLLRQNGINTGQKRLFSQLREQGYLIKSGASKNIPTQRSMEMGLFEIKEGSYVDGNGCNVTTKTTKVTGKGQQYFINKFLNPVQKSTGSKKEGFI